VNCLVFDENEMGCGPDEVEVRIGRADRVWEMARLPKPPAKNEF
jgi:hypothetical protein